MEVSDIDAESLEASKTSNSVLEPDTVVSTQMAIEEESNTGFDMPLNEHFVDETKSDDAEKPGQEIGKPSSSSSLTERVLPDRPALEIARDTKRILEICYGDPKVVAEKKKKKKKTKSGEKKREKTESDKETKKASKKSDKETEPKTVGTSEEDETGEVGGVGVTGDEPTSSKARKASGKDDKKKKKRKKRSKPKGSEDGNVVRDASGKIIRKQRKIKGRDRVVRKDRMKKGKDAKMELAVISEDSSGEDFNKDESDHRNENVASYSDASEDGHDNSDDQLVIDRSFGREGVAEKKGGKISNDISDSAALGPETIPSQDRAGNDGPGVDGHLVNTDENHELAAVEVEYESTRILRLNDSAFEEERTLVDATPETANIDIEANMISAPSVDSTACTSTAPERNRRTKPIPVFGSYRNLIVTSILLGFVVAGLSILAVYLLSIQDDGNHNPALPPSLVPTAAPIFSSPDEIFPTMLPTTISDTLSTSCQRPVKIPGKHVVQEAEYAPTFFGNASIGIEGEGFCGEGYVTNLTQAESGVSFLPFEVFETGFYRVAVRYNNADETDGSLLLRINNVDRGALDLIPTGNESTWMIQGIDSVLLRQGRHEVQVLVQSNDIIGPNIDWLSLSLQNSASRFEYLVGLLGPLTDISMQIDSRQAAIEWISNEDPVNWLSLSDEEIIERYALVSLYFATTSDGWANNNQWLSEFHVCNWYGIACSIDNLVTDVLLDNNNLAGTLPADLFLLTNAFLVSLDTNSLGGTIPEEIGELEQLEQLFLHANVLTGSLPSELGSLESLSVVDLRANSFSSPIPEELYSLQGLESLALASNALGGTLSTNVGKLTSLKHLDLQSDQLSGSLPTELGELTLLTSLSMGYNEFSGSIPSELGLLTNLSVLDINSNELTGFLPPELSLLNDTIVDYCGNAIVE